MPQVAVQPELPLLAGELRLQGLNAASVIDAQFLAGLPVLLRDVVPHVDVLVRFVVHERCGLQALGHERPRCFFWNYHLALEPQRLSRLLRSIFSLPLLLELLELFMLLAEPLHFSRGGVELRAHLRGRLLATNSHWTCRRRCDERNRERQCLLQLLVPDLSGGQVSISFLQPRAPRTLSRRQHRFPRRLCDDFIRLACDFSAQGLGTACKHRKSVHSSWKRMPSRLIRSAKTGQIGPRSISDFNSGRDTHLSGYHDP